MKLTRGLLAGGIALTFTLAGCGAKTGGAPVPGSGPAADGAGSSLVLLGSVNELADTVSTQSKTKQSAKIDFTFDAGPEKMTGDAAYRINGADAAMRMSMAAPEGAFELVMLDKTVYLKAPGELKATLGDGKEWLKISADGTDPLSRMMAPMVEQLGESIDINESMEKIRKAGTITKSAKENLDGTEVTHYSITIDLAKLEVSADEEAKKKTLQDKGVRNFDMELFLNADNLPVKMMIQLPVPNMGTVSLTMTFKDWGQPVDVTAPPADKVGTIPTK